MSQSHSLAWGANNEIVIFYINTLFLFFYLFITVLISLKIYDLTSFYAPNKAKMFPNDSNVLKSLFKTFRCLLNFIPDEESLRRLKEYGKQKERVSIYKLMKIRKALKQYYVYLATLIIVLNVLLSVI